MDINRSWPVCVKDAQRDIRTGLRRAQEGNRVTEICIICGEETSDGIYYVKDPFPEEPKDAD